MELNSLETIIRKYIALPSTPSSKGWYQVVCKACNDHGKKGPRGGFTFNNGSVGYHCFNCDPEHKTAYDPEKHTSMPHKMVKVLRAFGVPDSEWEQVLLDSLVKRADGVAPHQTTKKQESIEPSEIFKPKTFYNLGDAKPDDMWAELARVYLESRAINPTSHPFWLSKKTGDLRLDIWFQRIIIPVFKNKKLIFFTGRDLTDRKKKKYLMPSCLKHRILYGFDELFKYTTNPIYVVEGWFDAFVINGVAIFGNTITTEQIEWLNRSNRPKVYIPDRFGDGHHAAEKALELGWAISTPDIGNCKDINEAVVKYGKLYVLQTIVEKTTEDKFQSQIKLNLYCNHEKTTNKSIHKKPHRK